MPVLLDTKGNKVDLPWLAIHVLLAAYYDTRGSFNDTKRGDDGLQWTVVKTHESVTVQKEVDWFLVSKAQSARETIETNLYRATVRLKNLTSSLEVAKAAKNKEVIEQFEKELKETQALEASLTKEFAAVPVPDQTPEYFVFPASVEELKFGLPEHVSLEERSGTAQPLSVDSKGKVEPVKAEPVKDAPKAKAEGK